MHGVFSSLFSGKAALTGAQQKPSAEERLSQKILPTSDEAEHEDAPQPKPRVGQIALDVYEEGDYLIIKAPIAGVKLSDIDIDIAGNVVTIRGERKQMDEIVHSQYYLQECYWGEFRRSVTLPFSVDPSRVKATFNKDNVLKIFILKEKRVKIVKINEGG